MVDPSLQLVIEAMSVDERMELDEFIENSVDQSEIEVTQDQKAVIKYRAEELDADPSLGLTLGELDARRGSRWA